MSVVFEKTKINEKETGLAHFLEKKNNNQKSMVYNLVRTYLPTELSLQQTVFGNLNKGVITNFLRERAQNSLKILKRNTIRFCQDAKAYEFQM